MDQPAARRPGAVDDDVVHQQLGGGGFRHMQALGLAFLTVNSVAALYRSRDDPWNAAFVAAAYADLISLSYCLHLYERKAATAAAEQRRSLKRAIWGLSAVLIAMFTYRVALVMPTPVVLLVWSMAALTTFGGYCALFIYGDE